MTVIIIVHEAIKAITAAVIVHAADVFIPQFSIAFTKDTGSAILMVVPSVLKKEAKERRYVRSSKSLVYCAPKA